MFEDSTLGAQFLGNPQALQYQILNEITSRLNGNTVPVASSNNAFCVLLDASAGLTTQFVSQENSKFNALYPQRANFASQLYPHLSDFDYVNLTATPASLNFNMVLDKTWVVNKAVSYNENYSLLRIPADTIFQLGTRNFGIYYPIDIRVNKSNNLISVYYNIETLNPLKTYSSNLLSNVGSYTQNGVNYFQFAFQTWQFTVTEYNYTTSLSSGFSETISFNNQFYAARVFYLNENETWTEMQYSLSQMIYNQNTPTAIFTVLNEKNELVIDIPQIYFDNSQLSTSFKVQVYTTEGYINEPISPENAQHMQVKINTNESEYSAPFRDPPTLFVLPYGNNTILGGTDGQNLMAMKQQIVTGSLYKSVPISQSELTALVANSGFNLYKYLDNITDRIYYATSPLTFSSGDPVPVVVSPVVFTTASLNGQVSTILPFDDNLYTVLPTTVFTYSSETNNSTPLTDNEVSSLQGMSPSELISTINTTVHTRQPFHLVLNTSNKYPSATLFNLMNPTSSNFMFLSENPNMASILTVTSTGMGHLENGTGGFVVQASVTYTSPLKDIPKEDLSIFFFTQDKSERTIYFQASYLTTTTPTSSVQMASDIYSATIVTNYNITTDGYLCISALDGEGNQVDAFISLSQTWYTVGCINSSSSSITSIDTTYTPPYVVPPAILQNWVVTSQQSCTLTFGINLENLINANVNTTWGETVFQTYPTTVYRTYGKDVYLTDSQGNFVIQTNPTKNTVELVKLHSAGDKVLSEQNVQVTITETPLHLSSTISVNSVEAVLVGSSIRGVGIPVDAIVTAVDTAANTITLSQTPTSITAGTVLTLPTINANTTSTDASTTTTIDVDSTDNFLVGMTIVGFGIPSNTTITAVGNKQLTLSSTVDVTSGTYLYAFNNNGPYEVLHQAGDVMLGPNNQPIQLTPPTNVYGVELIQFDARIYEITDPQNSNYVEGLPTLLTSSAQQLNSVRDVLLERTQLYYKPLRSLGSAQFNIGNGKTVEMSLGISLTVTYYVTSNIKQNQILCNQITQLTIESIGNYLTNNRVYSTEDITTLLKQHFETNIISLAVSGFWNDSQYRFISIDDSSVVPCLAYNLKQSISNEMDLVPDVTVIFELAPTTAVTPITLASSVPTNPAV